MSDLAIVNKLFSPASYQGKPRHLCPPDRDMLESFWTPMRERVEHMSVGELHDLAAACLNVSPINCSWQQYAIAKMLHHAAIHELAVKLSDDPRSAPTHPKER